MPNQPIEIRCRIDPDGFTTCNEYDVRAIAVDRAKSAGLSTNGLEHWFELHAKATDLRDRDDAR